MDIKGKIKNYILESFLFTTDQNAIKDTDSFLEKGFIDSTGILEVISFIEEQFKIKVKDDEMIPENLDSIDQIVAFVQRKTA